MNWNHVGVVAVFSVVAACGPRAEFSPERTADFPSQEELDSIRTSALPSLDVSRVARPLDTWELRLDPRLEAGMAENTLPSDVEQAFVDAGRRATADEGALCVASELVERIAETGSGDDIDRFELDWIEARCGIGSLRGTYLWTENYPSDRLAQEAAELARDMGPDVLVGHARDGDNTYDVIYAANYRARIDSFSTSGDTFVIRGEFVDNTSWYRAMIAQGAYGYAECDADTTVQMPEFSITCPAESTDEQVLIEMWGGERNRILGPGVFSAWVSPDGSVPTTYTRNAVAGRAAALDVTGSEPPTADNLLDAINAVRGVAGLEPMTLEVAQSEAAASLVPYMIADSYDSSSNGEVGDTIARGLLAGWELESRVTNGSIATVSFATGEDVPTLVGRLVDEPSFRHLALSPGFDLFAVGVAELESLEVSSAVITAYDSYASGGVNQTRAELIERMNDYRADRGLEPMNGAGSTFDEQAIAAATSILQGEDAERAMRRMRTRCAAASSTGAGSYLAQFVNLDDFDLASLDEVLSRETLRISMALAMWPDPNSSWGTYLLVIAYKP